MDAEEEKVRIFIGGSQEALSEEEFKSHRAIAENVSLVVEALEGIPEYTEKAGAARRLVGQGKAVLWTVSDYTKFSGIAAPAYIQPDAHYNSLIPAMVFNRLWTPLTNLPSTWDGQTRDAVATAIVNLDSAYQAGLRFTMYHLIDQQQFFDLLSRGDPSRHRIIPLWDLVRR